MGVLILVCIGVGVGNCAAKSVLSSSNEYLPNIRPWALKQHKHPPRKSQQGSLIRTGGEGGGEEGGLGGDAEQAKLSSTSSRAGRSSIDQSCGSSSGRQWPSSKSSRQKSVVQLAPAGLGGSLGRARETQPSVVL